MTELYYLISKWQLLQRMIFHAENNNDVHPARYFEQIRHD